MLETLPIDVLLSILPLLKVKDLVSLSSTNKSFQELINGTNSELIWKLKLNLDLSFPVNTTARQTGWRNIYKKVRTSQTYIFGQNANGRLGLSREEIHRNQSSIFEGGLTIPTRINLPERVAGLVASGWSFHTLSLRGKISCFGTMDGTTYLPRNRGLDHPGFISHEPMILPQLNSYGQCLQLSAGRKHVVFRNSREEVWEYRAFGRVYRVVDPAWEGKTIEAVEAGWEHSAILTSGGEIFIWWEFARGLINTLAEEAGELELNDRDTEGVTFNVDVESIRLPSLPTSTSHHQGNTQHQISRIKSIACSDHFVHALTEEGELYRIDISPLEPPPFADHNLDDSPTMPLESREALSAAFISGERSWEYMKKFCEIEEIRKLPYFEKNGPPSTSTRINHISAHYQSFVAYSVPSTSDLSALKDSIVLLGTQESTTNSEPQIISGLQGKGVIQCVSGDYHHLALTSSGQVYSWGQFSAGALGIGHPRLSGSPLFNPTPNESQVPNQAPPPRIPGIFTRPRFVSQPSVQEVKIPTLIHFKEEDQVVLPETSQLENFENRFRTKGKFVFSIAAGGWHSGLCCFDLDDKEDDKVVHQEEGLEEVIDEKKDEEGEKKVVEETTRESGSAREAFNPRHLRIGYAGRGMRRGS